MASHNKRYIISISIEFDGFYVLQINGNHQETRLYNPYKFDQASLGPTKDIGKV